jgi:hypothetical protein
MHPLIPSYVVSLTYIYIHVKVTVGVLYITIQLTIAVFHEQYMIISVTEF